MEYEIIVLNWIISKNCECPKTDYQKVVSKVSSEGQKHRAVTEENSPKMLNACGH